MAPTPIAPLDQPVEVLDRVGPERAAQLHRLGIHTVLDLLRHRPRRYEDRRRFRAIRDLQTGESATVRGRIVAQGLKQFRKRSQSVFEFVLDDGTGRLHCRWWNLPFMAKYFAVGDDVMVYGRPLSLKPRTIDHPETEVIETGDEVSIHLDRIVPVYPLTEGLPQRWLRALLWRTLAVWGHHLGEPSPPLPDLLPRDLAFRLLHFPKELDDVEAARQRLAFDEFLELQIAIQTRRRNLQTLAQARSCAGDNRLIKPFLRQLGFRLTDAQTRVLRELRHDLAGPHPMRRLLQGDVGSGKTVVAACAALMTIESGFSVALMAPTEILARQHYENLRNWLSPLGVPVFLQTGTCKTGDAQPAATARLVVGTHALVESTFTVDNLGLVIIDEQHKFGVAHRDRLVRKGQYPHVLVMTATPIPRTLGLTLYGDLDVSVIDQLPPGRGRVRTFLRGAGQLPKVHDFVRRKLAEGRQAYVVYPRVEEDDQPSGLKAVTREFERLQPVFAPYRLGLLHGQLRPDEKEQVMADFRSGKVQVLFATAIIEVGVDVANATVMLIENADRFGLAQLHQLRGRIGRAGHESHCILLSDLKTPAALERLRVLEETTDGFRIAEADLRLRGPGEFLGQDQSGAANFLFGDLARDLTLAERARERARSLVVGTVIAPPDAPPESAEPRKRPAVQ